MRFRTAVTALTGLMLLAQGFALAAVVLPAPASAATAAMAPDMPCHHASTPATPKPPCCDEGCADMTVCATAHVAVASPSFAFISPATRLPALAHVATALPPPRAVFHLRPPIALHTES